MKSLFQKAGILCKGEQSGFPPQSFPTPQNHHHQPLFILEDAAGRIIEEVFAVAADDRQVSQSGKPLCTGASLWAVPKLAMGICPLEPRHVNSVSNPAKCSPDIPSEDLLIDQDAVLHPPKGNIAFPLMESPANLPAGKVMADL